MDHHRDVHVVESAGADERDLAAAALLRGRADRGDAPRKLVDHLAYRDGGGRADHRDEVVPAAVPEVGERVVFGEDRDTRAPSVLPFASPRYAVSTPR